MGVCLGEVRGQGAGLMMLGGGRALFGVEVAAGGVGTFSGVGGERLGNTAGIFEGEDEEQ